MKPLILLPIAAAALVVAGGIALSRQASVAPAERTLSSVKPAYSVVVAVADVHAAPDLNSPVLLHVSKPAILYASGDQQPAWRHVTGVNWQGWVAASDLTPNTFLVPDGHETAPDSQPH